MKLQQNKFTCKMGLHQSETIANGHKICTSAACKRLVWTACVKLNKKTNSGTEM